MAYTSIATTPENIGKTVTIAGWLTSSRDHGKITFLDISDSTGKIQCVGTGVPKVNLYSAVEIQGEIVERPEKLVNKEIKTGHIELQIKEIKILNESSEMPFDMGGESLNLELPTLLDWRPLTLKHPKEKAIFMLQSQVAAGFRKASQELHCTEVFTPTIAASSTEGGSEVFKVKYYDHDAFLIQSPQLYKQIAVGAFGNVFLFSHAYRAEPSVTTRHLTEVVQLDCEFAFVGFDKLLDNLEYVGTKMIEHASLESKDTLRLFGVSEPKLPKNGVPRLKLREAQEIITKRTGRDVTNEKDLNPEDEREICAWALEEHDSDFVTITHFPTKKRAFYTMPDPENPEFSLSYDLLFRGIEISSGSQRIHDYGHLKKAIEERGMDPNDFKLYLQAFQFGMPPEGGFSFGLERVTMKILELQNVRFASLFPRDMERIDTLLSKTNQK